MAFETGKNGTVKIGAVAVALVTGWEFDKSAETDQFGSNESAGYKSALAGTGHGRGMIRGKLNTAAAMTVLEGTAATLLLYVNATEFYSVPAIIQNFKATVDIDIGKATTYEATFVTNGAWTEPTWA